MLMIRMLLGVRSGGGLWMRCGRGVGGCTVYTYVCIYVCIYVWTKYINMDEVCMYVVCIAYCFNYSIIHSQYHLFAQ